MVRRFALHFLLVSFCMFAQNTGRLTGKVVDPTGASTPNATVALALPAGGAVVFSTVTSSEGYFSFTGIRPGTYDLVIRATGFQNHIIRVVKVDPGRETALPAVRLELGSVAEVVDVVASAGAVQTSNAEVASTITSQQVQNLPVLSRQMITLIKTQPGVSDGRGPTAINGLRTSSAAVTIDGINVQDNYLRSNSLDFMPNRPTIDQVAEVTVTTSNAAATIGGAASQVVMVTPSGSNEFHGVALWSNRNSAFSANDWFNNRDGIPNSFLNQNQFGGYLGGPVFKNKLLFYGGYERLDTRQSISVTRRILTGDARNGIFTYRAGSEVRKVNILQAAGYAADPTMQSLLQRVPGPDKINNFDLGDSLPDLLRNTAGYSFPVRGNVTRDNITGKVDYLASTRHVFSGTLLWNNEFVDRVDAQNDSTANLNGYDFLPKVFTDATRKLISGSWRWNPAPQFTNEARAGFNLAPTRFLVRDPAPEFQVVAPLYSNPSTNFRDQGRDTYSYHYQDNASYITGRHTLQFGFNLYQLRIRTFDTFNLSQYTVGVGLNRGLTGTELPGASANDIATGNALLASLAGLYPRAAQNFNITTRDSGFVPGAANERRLRFQTMAFYLQDNWKVRPRLSLTLGVRWEPFSPVDERDSLFLLPRLVDNNSLTTLGGNSTLDFAGKSAGRPWYGRDMNNFAPNVGLAWDIFGDGKSSFRAGYAVTFINDNVVRSLENNVGTNAGLQQAVALTGVAGRLSSRQTVPTPVFQVPTTFAERYRLSRVSAFGLPDPNLATPY
ncbi:MAG: TonB-dependent receptor domain-containing protein, partial [Bryobacteraceae bacterium]